MSRILLGWELPSSELLLKRSLGWLEVVVVTHMLHDLLERLFSLISMMIVMENADAYFSLLDVELVAHIFVLGPFVDLILSVTFCDYQHLSIQTMMLQLEMIASRRTVVEMILTPF